jgi:hypothetical protein
MLSLTFDVTGPLISLCSETEERTASGSTLCRLSAFFKKSSVFTSPYTKASVEMKSSLLLRAYF